MKRTPIKAKRGRPRKGPRRDVGYRHWVGTQRCVVCVDAETFKAHFLKRIHACHTRNNGMGSKGTDESCAPLCAGHHMEYDAGRDAFEARYGVDMQREAAEHWAVWSSGNAESE